MPLTSIVVVVLRLFAIQWFVTGFLSLLSTPTWLSQPLAYSWTTLLVPAFLLILAFVCFFFALPLARIATQAPHAEVNLGNLTRFDLYCFAFTLLGLYFLLSNVAGIFNWLHYYYVRARSMATNSDVDYYQFASCLIPSIAGTFCLFFAAKFSRRLTQLQLQQEHYLSSEHQNQAEP